VDGVDPPHLSLDQLEALKARWRAQEVPLLDRLQPGLSDERMDELTGALGLRLPTEARTWWRWHNGVKMTGGLKVLGELGPGRWFYSLEDAVNLYRFMRKITAEIWEDEADFHWRPEWFPITDAYGPIRCDCSVPEGAVTPIYWAFSHDYDERGLTDPRVPSFGTMVDWWLEALDAEWWHYDRSRENWVYVWERIPRERAGRGLV
jgi:SMI1/KNR4 family protein SUKH-1